MPLTAARSMTGIENPDFCSRIALNPLFVRISYTVNNYIELRVESW